MFLLSYMKQCISIIYKNMLYAVTIKYNYTIWAGTIICRVKVGFIIKINYVWFYFFLYVSWIRLINFKNIFKTGI